MCEWFLKPEFYFRQSSLILFVISIVADVEMEAGLPMESYVNQDNQQAYWSPVESLIVKELWSRQVEIFGTFQEGTLSTTVFL